MEPPFNARRPTRLSSLQSSTRGSRSGAKGPRRALNKQGNILCYQNLLGMAMAVTCANPASHRRKTLESRTVHHDAAPPPSYTWGLQLQCIRASMTKQRSLGARRSATTCSETATSRNMPWSKLRICGQWAKTLAMIV